MKNVTELTSVTYNFADGTKQVQPINKGIYIGERNKKRSYDEVINVLRTTSLDKGAVSFTIDSESNDTIEVVKEEYFTAKERYNAKRDYIEFKSKNPQEFFKQQQRFRAEMTDKLKRRLRFNLTNLSYLN